MNFDAACDEEGNVVSDVLIEMIEGKWLALGLREMLTLIRLLQKLWLRCSHSN